MRTYEEIVSDARPDVAFPNGSCGERWYYAHCMECINEPEDQDEQAENGCPLWTAAVCEGVTPLEWTATGGSDVTAYSCAMFRHRDDGPDPEPRPIPDPPGQDAMFPREPFEGVRMFADSVPALEIANGGAR